MRNYMPGPHRRFLENLSAQSNLRPWILASSEGSPERQAYNSAVERLKSYRDVHIQIVTRYIVLASRKPQPGQRAGKVNLATVSARGTDAVNHRLAGTGGTELMPFLKQTRDTARDAKC